MGWIGYRIGGMAALATASALAGCAEPPPPPPAAPVAAAPAPPRLSGGIVLSPQPEGSPSGPVLANDPSAPADTPLCGVQAREASAIGQSLLPQQQAEAGICSGFACYDPATATYVGADGYRHVCR